MIIPLVEFAHIEGKNKENFYSLARENKKDGVYPGWYIPKEGKNKSPTKIDTKRFHDWYDRPLRIQKYASSKLYWMFRAINFNDFMLSAFMAKRSKYYTSIDSWNMFFSNGLFLQSTQIHPVKKPTMTTEFIKIGTKYLYLMHKWSWNKFDLSKLEEFYEI